MPALLSSTLTDKLVAPSSSWSRLWSPVQAMVSRFIQSSATAVQPPASRALSPSSIPACMRSTSGVHRPNGLLLSRVSDKSAASDTRCALGGLHSFRKDPVRVIRLSEQGIHRGQAGRMVISGRMADVCAELDRLADREAIVH